MSQKLIVKKNGAVFTPEMLSDYFAAKTLQYVLEDTCISKKKKLSIIDPACGDGQLLKSIGNQIIQKQIKNVNFCGLDKDFRTTEVCKQKLNFLDKKAKLSILKKNSLMPLSKGSLREGWEDIFQEINQNKKFDILIANPPWGADISQYRGKLDSDEFSSLQNSVDSFELFVELATKIVEEGGYFSFIVPDSILNHGKSVIRDILTTNTEIKFIARLGEKIFPGINRACVIIICKNSQSSKNNVDCFRLLSKDKKKILNGKLTFFEAEEIHSHKIPQKRFLKNPYKQFDIDLKENETAVLSKLKTSKSLGDMLSSTRGVELGISGEICQCENCSLWSPLSDSDEIQCTKCGEKFANSLAEKEKIVSTKKTSNSVPIITGMDMKRYSCNQTKWIKLGKNGINYKSREIYESPKILIRKTGVGITAGIDYSSSYTTQVVYILKNKKETNPALEFFIALINSRVYYFYLVKSFGEVEWKSHPYLTQTQIKDLPLPDLEDIQNKKIIKEIVAKLRPILKKGKPSNQIDLEIELLVGKLFSLSKKDYKIIFNSIDESEELLPVKELKNIQLKQIISRMK